MGSPVDLCESSSGNSDKAEWTVSLPKHDKCHPKQAPTEGRTLMGNKKGIARHNNYDAAHSVDRVSCHQCSADLSSLHYLQRISHIKACLNRQHRIVRHNRPASGVLTTPETATRRDDSQASNHNRWKHAASATQQEKDQKPNAAKIQGDKKNKAQIKRDEMRKWMESLDLITYFDRFVEEEIDMTIVHVLTDRDLSSLGISDRLLQRRFMDAARKYSRQHPHTSKAYKCKTSMDGDERSARDDEDRILSSSVMKVKNEGFSDVVTKKRSGRSVFQMLMMPHLLQEDCTTEQKKLQLAKDDRMGAASHPSSGVSLGRSLVRIEQRVPEHCSLWTAAARCQQMTDSLEVRLATKRMKHSTNGYSYEPLSRGGIRYDRRDESRAMKAMKLQALQEELAHHEATVKELKALIDALQRELNDQ